MLGLWQGRVLKPCVTSAGKFPYLGSSHHVTCIMIRSTVSPFFDRLVEALEDYEGGDGDAYSDMSADQSLLSGGHKRRVSIFHLTPVHEL